MLRLVLFLTVLVLSLGSASAETLSPTQCRADDWQKVGKSDGYYGFSTSRFDQYAKTCTQYGVTPNLKQYQAGYAVGLKLYCTLDRAVSEGTSGNPYRKMCTGELGTSFARVHAQAHRVFLARTGAAEIKDNSAESGDSMFSIFGLRDGAGVLIDGVRVEERKLDKVLDAERLRLKRLGIKG